MSSISAGVNTGSSEIDFTEVINKLQEILESTQEVDGNTDSIESELTTLISTVSAGNATLTTISNTLTTSILPQLVAINANTDQVETLIATTNSALATLIVQTDNIEPLIGNTNTLLATIIDLLTPTKKVRSRGFTTTVNIGDDVKQTIEDTVGLGESDVNIKSITVMAYGNSLSMDITGGAAPLEIPENTSMTWNQSSNNYLNELEEMIFLSGGRVTIIYEFE